MFKHLALRAVLASFVLFSFVQTHAAMGQIQSAPTHACKLAPGQPDKTISGTISDPSGAGVGNAAISLTCGSTRIEGHVSKDGSYVLNALMGTYDLEVDAPGFSKVHKQVVIAEDGIVGENIALTVANSPETITVTAEKASEQTQNVAESVTVVSSDALLTMPFDPFESLAQHAPNVAWVNFASNHSSLSIRGVGTLGQPSNNDDATIAVNMDGVPGTQLSLTNQLLDVDHIEALRGPQGTEGGANGLGGAINVVYKQPDGTRDFHVTAEGGGNVYRNEEQVLADGSLVPVKGGASGYQKEEVVAAGNIIPGLLDGRAAFRYSNYDGDIYSLYTHGFLNAMKVEAVRAGLRFTPTDRTDATLTGSFMHSRGNAPFYLARGGSNFPISGTDTPADQNVKQTSGTLNIRHIFDWATLTSLTGFQRNLNNEKENQTDAYVFNELGIPIQIGLFFDLPAAINNRQNVYSQELRLNSLEGAKYRWVIGANAVYKTDWELHDEQTLLGEEYGSTSLKTTNFGVFGDVTIPFNRAWSLSLGARVGYDDIHAHVITDEYVAPIIPYQHFNGRGSTNDGYITGRAALSYKWRNNATTYFSVARGHSPRVYPLLNTPIVNGAVADAYPAATDWTYEGGTKLNLLANRVSLDGSVFYNNVKNAVLTYLDPTVIQFLTFYQSYHSSGFEVQGKAQITHCLSLQGGGGYTHAILGSGSSGDNVNGNVVPNVPRWTTDLGLLYKTSANLFGLPGDIYGSADYPYVGAREADVLGSFGLHPYGLVNLKTGWQSHRHGIDFYGFAYNLQNNRFETFGAVLSEFGVGAQTVLVGRGRIAGGGISKQF